MVHGYAVHSVLASYNIIIIIVHVYSVYVKQEGGVIARSYDKSRDNAPPTLAKKGVYLRDNTVHG